MSHFTRVQTIILDQVLLEEALHQMGYEYETGDDIAVRGHQGNTESAQLVIRLGSRYDIGFQRQDDQTYAVCADWWGVKRNSQIQQDAFIQKLNRTYAHVAVKHQALEQGLIIEEERVLENGDIELVVCERF
jgi:hypothetical protein